MGNWIWTDASWHLLVRVDAAGWRTACGLIVTWDAPVRPEEPPTDERWCARCHDLYEEPVP
jgi:hypothetical protein